MLTQVKLKNWLLTELEDIAICYFHNIPFKLLSTIYNRESNAIEKLMERTGMQAYKKACGPRKKQSMRRTCRTHLSVCNFVEEVRAQYPTPQLLHQYLCPEIAAQKKSIPTKSDKKTVSKVNRKQPVIEVNQWTSLQRIIKDAQELGYDVVQKDLTHISNTSALSNFLICNGMPTTVHQLLLVVNKQRLKKGQPLLFLEGITNL